MNRSLLALAVALGMSAALPAAYADEMNASSLLQPTAQLPEQSAQSPSQTVPNDAALQDYRRNINPNTNIPITGIYDQEDRFEGPTGRPLPGWGSVGGQGAGDN